MDRDVAIGTAMPPVARECEAQIIGNILAYDAYEKVNDLLKEEYFYEPKHQVIYHAATSLYDTNKPVDVVSVVSWLRDHSRLDEIGGLPTVLELSKSASVGNLDYACEIVFKKHFQRKLIHVGIQLQGWANDNTRDVEDTLNEAEQALFDVTEVASSTEPMSMKECIGRTHEDIQKNFDRGGVPSGVLTGYRDIDALINGFKEDQLIVIAARPAMGKTAFVLSMADRMAYGQDKKLLFFSLEMGEKELVRRLLVARTEINMRNLENGTMTGDDWGRLYDTEGALLAKENMFIDSTPYLTVSQLRSKARKMKRKKGIDVIIIDYLQLLSAKVNDRKFSNRQEEVSHISRQLKALSKELHVPVIALSQLSRAVESRPDKSPQLSDLRESGAIEQDADMIAFLYRPEYYGETQDKMGRLLKPGTTLFQLKKNRGGAIGEVELHFEAELIRFDDQQPYENYGVQTYNWTQENSLPSPNYN